MAVAEKTSPSIESFDLMASVVAVATTQVTSGQTLLHLGWFEARAFCSSSSMGISVWSALSA